MSERIFDPQAHIVDPALAGRSLPSPRRRVLAFAIDYVLLLLPTAAAALLFAGLALRLSDPAGFAAVWAAASGMPREPAARPRCCGTWHRCSSASTPRVFRGP